MIVLKSFKNRFSDDVIMTSFPDFLALLQRERILWQRVISLLPFIPLGIERIAQALMWQNENRECWIDSKRRKLAHSMSVDVVKQAHK